MTFEKPEENPDVILPMNNLNDVTAIDYDVMTDFLYWIDSKSNFIKQGYINGTHVEVLNLTGNAKDKAKPFDLSVDPYGGQLFWTDEETNTIMVYSLKHKKSLGVMFGRGEERPRSIVLFPEKG